MGDRTGIEWTDATWNVTAGCDHVSPGCDHCYAARLASGRLAHLPAYAGVATDGRFTGNVRLLPDRLDQPLRWRKPRRVFVDSMADLFHDKVPADYIARVFAVMAAAPRHTFQVLTKRHGRMRSLLGSAEFDLAVADEWGKLDGGLHTPPYPLPNVWVGVSVEDQKRADLRIPALLDTPAAVRFLSCEPLLGPVDLRGALGFDWVKPETGERQPVPSVDWVIVGGEAGPGSRPMRPHWASTIRDQCVDARVPFLFKQWGDWVAAAQGPTRGWSYVEWDQDPRSGPVYRVGKRQAGRELDGRTWDQYPLGPWRARVSP